MTIKYRIYELRSRELIYKYHIDIYHKKKFTVFSI